MLIMHLRPIWPLVHDDHPVYLCILHLISSAYINRPKLRGNHSSIIRSGSFNWCNIWQSCVTPNLPAKAEISITNHQICFASLYSILQTKDLMEEQVSSKQHEYTILLWQSSYNSWTHIHIVVGIIELKLNVVGIIGLKLFCHKWLPLLGV